MTSLWEIVGRFAGLFVWWTIVAPWEAGIRVRLGNRVATLGPGIHLKIPHLDQIFKQTVRMRVTTLQLQTITTLDGKTITLCATVGYCISDIALLYNTLHHADETIRNITAGHIAKIVRSCELNHCRPEKIEQAVNADLNLRQYGLDTVTVRIVDFAAVKTYRLLSDQRWMSGDLDTTVPVAGTRGLPA